MPVVLFTCAGQRVDIVTAFARAGATTLAVDVDRLAPALYAAERRALVPPVRDPGYIDALCRLIDEHDAQLIVPLADLDHLLLATERDRLSVTRRPIRWSRTCAGVRSSRSTSSATSKHAA